ncbi:MAG: ABC transporter ATP-binding protein [Pseudomonadales bacterium]
MTRYLEFSRIGKVFQADDGPFEALCDVSLTIDRGEFVTLIGHSGCGKSTLLNIVAGLEAATTGAAILEGREIFEPGPDRAVVFQHHALMPWLSCYGNVELAVRQVFRDRKTRAEMRDWILHTLRLVDMDHAADRMPHEISGGMKQRVGIARCLAMEPKVVLMDEPFGALDALTRAKLQDTVMEIQAALANTVIMITHDVDEAVLLSDRILMMTNGPSATIGDVVDVALPRPRERLELAENAVYNHYRRVVLDFLYAARRGATAGRDAAALTLAASRDDARSGQEAGAGKDTAGKRRERNGYAA